MLKEDNKKKSHFGRNHEKFRLTWILLSAQERHTDKVPSSDQFSHYFCQLRLKSLPLTKSPLARVNL